MKTKLETACASSRLSSSKIISLLDDKTIIPTMKALQSFLTNKKLYYNKCRQKRRRRYYRQKHIQLISSTNIIKILNKFKNKKITIDINMFKQYINDINSINASIPIQDHEPIMYDTQFKIIKWCTKYTNLYTQEILELICNSRCITVAKNIEKSEQIELIENFIKNGCVMNINCLENLCESTTSNNLIQYVCQKYNILPTQKCLGCVLKQITLNDSGEINILEYIFQHVQCDHALFDIIINNYTNTSKYNIVYRIEDIDEMIEKYIFNSTSIIFTTDDLIKCINDNIGIGIEKLINIVPLNYNCLSTAIVKQNYLLAIEIINKNIDPTIEILKLISNKRFDYYNIDAINLIELIINKGILPDDECIQIATKNKNRVLLKIFYKNLQNYTFTIDQLYDACKLQLNDVYKQIITQINPDYHCLELTCHFMHDNDDDKKYISPIYLDPALEIIMDLVNTWKYLPTNKDIKNLCEFLDGDKILKFFKTIGYNFDNECISNILQYGFTGNIKFLVENDYLFSNSDINILMHRMDTELYPYYFYKILITILNRKNNKLTLEQLKQIKSIKKLRPNMISKLIDYVE